MSPRWRPVFLWMRTLHVYLTMLGLVLLLFFSSTGFMLNHKEWFGVGDEPRVRHAQAALPTGLLQPGAKSINELAMVEELRAKEGAVGAVDLPLDVTDDEVRVTFRKPGQRFDAVITRATGKAEITIESTGLAGLLTDLHKGSYTGRWWHLCLDTAALSLMAASLTGFILWMTLPRRRPMGLAALATGLVACLLIWWLLVP